ncbi:glycoside hydrolase/phage tail family protein [Actibacterium sp. 188UL27-1]|uniref:baseplate multidomain protein megatron n=1 Tax=Actibacterium sp. 188UL27-1 TaxID=2786961 RepID=UPI001957128A|nr:glycoside hydrolase/phage tail family protein [Actibacterium sp. 188UL27-1]MBM7068028.1 glycoside hydrolase/phage tail family protein [Actibacterium sp. 188UL27-1]
MATILLSAAGAAAGSAFGGSFLGLSATVLGKAVGATLGKVIDQRLLGTGSEVVETGKVERFRVSGAGEGEALGQVFGRVRLGGQVIWASRFQERISESGGGGKGSPPQPKTRSFSYSVSLAVALCEGEITSVGRVWADGVEIARDSINMRVYTGTEDQLPDSKMEAVEGTGLVPAYRGIAYVVIEDLALSAYGNRVPQFSFEVIRPADPTFVPEETESMSRLVQAVALMPGTGEYALATTPVRYKARLGDVRSANLNAPSGKTDFATSLDQLTSELPNCSAVSLIVSWFGDDLRCGACQLRPKVEQRKVDGVEMPWRVSGVSRGQAEVLAQVDGRTVYGGTPTDASIIQAIRASQEAGQRVMFYPFILMEQLAENGLSDPWTGELDQPVLPWRGRITLSAAPGQAGSPDQTPQADAEVAAFMGQASVSDFSVSGSSVTYSGPAEWSFRRFILHYAHLCAAAGGVEAFCIGSELRGLTQIRGAAGFPVVEALRQLARDVRQILPDAKISYAADWSEYFGYRPEDGSGDVYFHLDPLWADPDIDFIGIDNYMPLSDWRDKDGHLDAVWDSIYDLEYLTANIDGGEGYDWFYASDADRLAQARTPITDGAHGEPWIYRYKDLYGWWNNPHHERIGGVRQVAPTGWIPQSKPFWFTELGSAAIDKATNQPNKFLDPKSSESSLPHFSNGGRDDLIQAQYLRAMDTFWADADNNPVSAQYGAAMVDMSNAHVWAWDARPFPNFPGNTALWSDGANYARGHWLNGRTSNETLGAVVAEICGRVGLTDIDVRELYRLVRGYSVADLSGGRAALQPLMLAYGFQAIERDGILQFRMRNGKPVAERDTGQLAYVSDIGADIETVRAPEAETAGRVRLSYVEADGDFEARATEAIFPDDQSLAVSQSDLPIVLNRAEARAVVERWLSESRIARDTARFALPPSDTALGAGDVVRIGADGERYRIDAVELADARIVDAVRVEDHIYDPQPGLEEEVTPRPFTPVMPVLHQFLDLPLLTGNEVEHAPHVAAAGVPWTGPVAVYQGLADNGYALNTVIETPSLIGETLTDLPAGPVAIWDRGNTVRVEVVGGTLSSAEPGDVLNGINAMAIGDGSPAGWEIFQFAEADLIAPDTYELRNLLRGQAGTDAVMPSVWPVGSRVVLLDGRPQQIDLPVSARGLERHYRVGPAALPYDAPSYEHGKSAFDGIGLRPYAPVHLNATRQPNGDLAVRWLRRTRIDGDSWAGLDVPLGEGSEVYQVSIWSDDTELRSALVASADWTYAAADQLADGVTAPFELRIAQVSDRFGPGPFRRIVIND